MIPLAKLNRFWTAHRTVWVLGFMGSPGYTVLRPPVLRTRALMGEDCRRTGTGPFPLLVFSWWFTCIDLWKTCVHLSAHLPTPLANAPVLVHRLDLFPLAQETGVFYVDEIIIADTDLTGDHRIRSPPWTCPSNAELKLFC